jgi:uncharacterized protein
VQPPAPESPLSVKTPVLSAPSDLGPQTDIPTGLLPIENPVWSGWDVLLIAVLALVSVLVLQAMVLLSAKLFVYPHTDLAEIAQKPILLLVSQFLIYIPVAVCMFLLVEGKYHVRFWKAIRWNWPDTQWGLAALGMGAVMLVVLSMLQFVLPMPKETPFEHLFDRPRDAYLLALLAVSIGPLMEELFFRGFMYPVLARRIGAMWGILLTALPFGLLHLQQYGWAWSIGLIIFLVGVVCGVVRATTKSVAASFLVHVGYNGAQMLIAVLETHGFRHLENATAVPFWVR